MSKERGWIGVWLVIAQPPVIAQPASKYIDLYITKYIIRPENNPSFFQISMGVVRQGSHT